MADPIIKYTGDGSDYHVGIPARDLSGAEFDALDSDQQAVVRASAIFDYAGYAAGVKAAQAKDVAKPAADVPAPKTDGK